MKKYIFLIFLSFSLLTFNGCNSDDDESGVANKTFLKTYGGTTWEVLFPEDKYGHIYQDYLRINNSTNNPIDIWEDYISGESDDEICYDKYEIFRLFLLDSHYEITGFEVIDNSSNKLECVYQYYYDSYGVDPFYSMLNLTYTVSNNELKIVAKDEKYGTATILMDKSSVNVNDLPICD